MIFRCIAYFAIALPALISCDRKITPTALKKKIVSRLEKQKGTFAVAFKDLSTGEELLINDHELFHAASTMKVPVMIEAFKLVADGKISLTDSILIKNEFKSIVDNGPYRLKTKDDSEFDLYKIVGQKRPLSELIYKMITASSNLATNILIEQVGADQTTQTMRELGAMDILVLRGVEDSLAHAHKLDNTVTAYDLMLIFEKMANGEVVSQEASRAMIAILLDQKFNTIIPARLPTGARVAHKTGWFKGLHHDAGIVFLADGKKYVLVILSRGLEDEDSAVKAMARVSATLYKYVNHSHAKWP